MANNTIIKILKAHCITYKIDNNRVIADDVYTQNGVTYTNTIDVTDYTKKQLYTWLGY